MRSALTENLRGGAALGPLFLVLVLIAAVLAVPMPVFAANVSFSIPTKVELKLKADGTVIAPSADAWKIRNLGDEPIQLTSVGSDGFHDGETVAANSGTWSLSVKDAASQSGTMTIQPASQTGVSWSVPALGALGAKISSGPYTAGSISFEFQAVDDLDPDPNGTAFAVYSADDNSLDFYKRDGTPHVGHLFNGKTVTEVYTGIESYAYGLNDDGHQVHEAVNPWWSHHLDIKSVKAVDDGIVPKSMLGWFYFFENLETIDLKKLDTSQVKSFYATFDRCRKVKELDLSNFSTSNSSNFGCMFWSCENISNLDLRNFDFSKASNLNGMFSHCALLSQLLFVSNPDFGEITGFGLDCVFQDCPSIQFDCSDWIVDASAEHGLFNFKSPGVVLPKAWQTSANSLDAAGFMAIKEDNDASVFDEGAVEERSVGRTDSSAALANIAQAERSDSSREDAEEQPAETKSTESDQLVKK